MESILREYVEGGALISEFKFTFSRCNINKTVKLPEILIILSDLVDVHGRMRGHGYEFLQSKGFVFFLAKTSVNFLSSVNPNVKLTVKSWDYMTFGMEFLRNYEMFDENGSLILTAQTSWTCVDTDTHKIVRPSSYPYYDDVIDKKIDEGKECRRIPTVKDATLIRKHIISFEDLDANGHVNNAQYGNIILGAIPFEFAKRPIKHFEINYSREVVYGEELQIFTKMCENEISIDGEKDGKNSFRSVIEFF